MGKYEKNRDATEDPFENFLQENILEDQGSSNIGGGIFFMISKNIDVIVMIANVE